MKIGAMVPARIGSKRLKKKNIKLLGNKPLICWTLDVLLEADIFYDITVSTESEEIMEVVREYYSSREVKILKRPKQLAGDDSPLKEVLAHYLENRSYLDWYGLFMPTFPFREKEKLIEAYNEILTGYPTKIDGITQRLYCNWDFFYYTEEGVKRFFKPKIFYCPYRVPVYEMHTVTQNYNQEIIYDVSLSFKETIDIDTLEDFLLAQELINSNGNNRIFRLKRHNLSPTWDLLAPEHCNLDKIIDYLQLKTKKILNEEIIILREDILPLSFYYIYGRNWNLYLSSREASSKLTNEKVMKTQNMKYFDKHYRHSIYFRLINKNLKETQLQKDEVIPWERVIFEKDLLKLINPDFKEIVCV